MTELDAQRLSEALALAELAIGLSDPNPRVGCVIGRESGEVLGQGHTQRAGEAHAEVMALRSLAAQGRSARGATAWVTLEPCSHHGRTPPCTEALIDAGIRRVVVAATDPYPAVNGAGIARLSAAGVEVVLAESALAEPARELNIGFFTRCTTRRPWVRLKLAASLDGRSALADGSSQWITGEAARADGHRWRRRAGAILTGIGTVLHDDPRLDNRLAPSPLSPLRVVLDTRWRTPEHARLLDPPGQALVVGLEDGAAAFAERMAGRCECLSLPAERAGDERTDVPSMPRPPRVRLDALLDALGERQVNELHLECGPSLAGSFCSQGLVDELLVYQAPRLVGPGRPMVDLPPLHDLNAALPWRLTEVCQLGEDLRLRLRSCRQT